MKEELVKINVKEQVETLAFKLHTIILLVGPDGSGKSQFAKLLSNSLRTACDSDLSYFRAPVISYDDIAFNLYGYSNIDKYSIELEQIRDQAENLLLSNIKSATSYPVNSNFVIVDYTSLKPEFRDKIIELAEEQHYNLSAIVFDYQDKADYKTDAKKSNFFQIRAIKQTASLMPAKLYDSKFVFRKPVEYSKINIVVSDCSKYYSHYLDGDCSDYLIVGDIHGCYDEFISLIEGEGFIIGEDLKVTHPKGKKVLLIGDLIDKGRDIPKVIELAYANIGIFVMVIGNHESFVYKVFKGLMPGTSITDVMKKEFFQTLDILEENEPLREKFYAVVEAMKEFYIHRDFIVTHAPCDVKYLGKVSTYALKSMRDLKYPKTRDYMSFGEFIHEFDETIDFMKAQAREFHPLHIFGHIVTAEVSEFKNKVAIDTGCATGGELTGLYVLAPGRIAVVNEKSLTNKKDNQKFYNFFD